MSWLVRRYVAGRTDITLKAREGYEWAIPHIGAGIGAIPIARLDRENVADWIEGSPLEAGCRAEACKSAARSFAPHWPTRSTRA